MIYDIMILGAGASGLAAAISAKRTEKKLRVAVLEALPRVGKKILATGNGRCNLTNINAVADEYTNSAFVRNVLEKYPSERVIEFFGSIGVLTVTDSEGRVYPMSNMATSVLDALRFECERLGVDFLCESRAGRVRRVNGIFDVDGKIAKRVIVATGGCASPSQGSDGSGYAFLKALGHSITETFPGLVQLNTVENTKPLKGVRIKAKVTLLENGKIIDTTQGEVLFTDYGLSGIATMDVSRSVKHGKYSYVMDMLTECDKERAESFLHSVSGDMPAENAISGMLPKKIGQYILKKCGISFLLPVKELSESQIKSIVRLAKRAEFTVNGTQGFKNAQVTVGGASVNEFDSRTLQSRLVNGLYAAGEVLDVDSRCGGFNLQWAWASGLAAGEAAAGRR